MVFPTLTDQDPRGNPYKQGCTPMSERVACIKALRETFVYMFRFMYSIQGRLISSPRLMFSDWLAHCFQEQERIRIAEEAGELEPGVMLD